MSAHPVAHSLLQFGKIVFEQVGRALFSPSQYLREVIASSKGKHRYWHFRMVDIEFAEFWDDPHDCSISSANDQDSFFVLVECFFELGKPFVSDWRLSHVKNVESNIDFIISIDGILGRRYFQL